MKIVKLKSGENRETGTVQCPVRRENRADDGRPSKEAGYC